MYEGGLQQVQGEHGDLGVFAVRPGEVAVLAVEDHRVAGVPVLHHLVPAMDLAAQFGRGEVVTGEDGAHRPAEFLQRLVGGVLGSAAGEAVEDRLPGVRGVVQASSSGSLGSRRGRSSPGGVLVKA